MKKKNLIFCLFISILCLFSVCLNKTNAFAYAGEIYTITFNPTDGECLTSSLTTDTDGKLSTLPTPTYENHYFVCWKDGENEVSIDTIFTQNTTLNAIWTTQINSYSISYNNPTYTVIGKTADANTDYLVSNSLSTIEDAITAINDDAISSISQITINFDNITATNNINISAKNYILTGTINLETYSLNISSLNNTNVDLSNLTLSSTSSQNLVNVNGTNKINLSVSNTNFNSTISTNNYAINFQNPIHSVVFCGTLSCSTNYLYNYKHGLDVLFDESFSLSGQSQVSITIPYTEDDTAVLKTSKNNKSIFNFCPTSNLYTCQTGNKNGIYLYVNIFNNITFEENGGTISSSYTTTNFRYNSTTKNNFPSTEITQTHKTMTGFVGKLQTGPSSYLYFDKTSLASYITTNATLADASTYFSVTIPIITNTGFSYYQFDSTETDLNYLATKLMLENNQVPTFVATWTDTQYSIFFEENGGTTATTISGLFGSNVSLPSITKTGCIFDGWYNESTFSTKSTLTTMPDTNPTLYAHWIANKHTLSIYQNNGSNKIEKETTIDTTFSSITEMDSTLITKDGHTFVGWFTDENLQNELTLLAMPNNDFSVYAKWQINSYTISLYNNHKTNTDLYKTTTKNYGTNIYEFLNDTPSFIGYKFLGWYTDEFGQFFYNYQTTTTVPSQNLTLYACWTPIEYTLKFYNGSATISLIQDMHYGDNITIPNAPTIPGKKFINWFSDSSLTEIFNLETMPNSNLSVYAKYIDKEIISFDESAQTYTLEDNKFYIIDSNLTNFTVQYLIGNNWSNSVPTQKGTYDVKITRLEDDTYQAYNKIISKGLVITANKINLTVYYYILYGIAIAEMIASIILLFMRKQKKSYLSYTIVLPFGVIEKIQFINLLVSLSLFIFGLILLIIQIVKLHNANSEITRDIKEEKSNIPPDISQNETIAQKVDILLNNNGFSDSNKETDK